MDNKVLLEIKELTKFYESNGNAKKVLDKFSLRVNENEFLCILGPSGCGKTTLLRCVAGFEDYQGDIYIEGKKIQEPNIDRIMVFQDFNQLFPWKNVEGNICYALKLQGIKDKCVLNDLCREVLAKVNLSGYEKYYPHQLSGGMKQRVAIAKALALKPKIILMDEPFASLDAITRNNLQKELINISVEEKCTIIFITHNIQEAIVLGTKLIVLQEGGTIVINEKNPLCRPISPSSLGYGDMWNRYYDALYASIY